MGREGARKGKSFIAISMLPDVCNTPFGSTMVPVPYTVTANLDESIGVSRNVFFGGAPAFTLNTSTVPRVRGDEAGTGRGVKSGGHMGKVEPIEGNSKVLVNGNPVVRHGDRCKMNDGNTIGKIYCTDAARPGCGIYNGKPTGDTNPPFFSRASANSSASSEVLHQAKGVAIGAKDAVVDMAQGAWDMAKGAGRLLNPETAAAQAEEIRKTVSGIAHDPKSLWEAIIQPYAEAISNGEYGNALGRGLVDVGTMFIGGISGAGKAGEATSVAAKTGKGARAAAGGLVNGLRKADDGVVISGRANVLPLLKPRVSNDVSEQLRPKTGKVAEKAELQMGAKDEFITLGLDKRARRIYLDSAEGKTMQTLLREADPGQPDFIYRARADRLLRSGKDIPTIRIAENDEAVYKLMKLGEEPTAYTPFWLKSSELSDLKAKPSDIANRLGLPNGSVSESGKYAVWETKPLPGTRPMVFESTVAPTVEGSTTC